MSAGVMARQAETGAVWTLQRGATVLPGGGVSFSVWAPQAKRMRVVIESGGGAGEHELDPAGDGVWAGIVGDAAPGTRYRYRLDEEEAAVPDPCSRHQPEGVHGASEVVDPHAHEWRDEGWTGLAMPDYIIYELHIGTFTDEGTFDAAIGKLERLKELGVSAIEIMPVAEFPGARNWGYDGVALYAPHSAYGGADGLKRLVDAAHAIGLAVVLDVVYNHVGPEGNYLPKFGPYFTELYKTPWGPAVNYDGPESENVRRFVIDNALYWITEYHMDGLRLDAVHGIYDFGAKHLLQELTESVHAAAASLGRRVQIIAESDLNDPRLLRPPARGGFGMDAQWADDLHHALHATLTGERTGYYADFPNGAADVARALEHRFIYTGQFAPHRKRRHGAPATDVPADRFVVCIQNHDQVGNRAAGERISTLTSFERQKLGAALYILSPYVPMLFMGEEWGETNPFQYFVSHGDEQLVDAVREGRRKEFEAFGWGDDVPDPQAEDTFRRSKLNWSRTGEPQHAAMLALYRDLIALKRRERALRPGDAVVRVSHDSQAQWIVLELVPASGDVLAIAFNLADEPREVPLPGHAAARWTTVLSTADSRYGRAGAPPSPQARGVLIVPSNAAVALRRERA